MEHSRYFFPSWMDHALWIAAAGNCYPSDWHRCPNPNCNARFWSKKNKNPCLFFPYSSILRILTFHAFTLPAGVELRYDGYNLSAATITLRTLHQPIGKMSYLNLMYEKGNVSIREEKKYRKCSIRQVTSNIKSNVKEIDIKVSFNYDKTNLMLI